MNNVKKLEILKTETSKNRDDSQQKCQEAISNMSNPEVINKVNEQLDIDQRKLDTVETALDYARDAEFKNISDIFKNIRTELVDMRNNAQNPMRKGFVKDIECLDSLANSKRVADLEAIPMDSTSDPIVDIPNIDFDDF